MLTKALVWAAMERAGLIRYDAHIAMGNGMHTKVYASFIPALMTREQIDWVVDQLRPTTYPFASLEPDERAIVGIGCGGNFATLLAYHLGIPWAYAEEGRGGVLQLNRNQGQMIAGREIMIVDDVFVSGSTIRKLAALVEQHGGKPNRIGVILNRTETNLKEFDYNGACLRFDTIFHHPMPTYPDREHCVSCKAGIPLSTEHGAGAEQVFMHGQPQRV
ncbi:MAG: phosphoribosyltransferase [Patescibacteria group bacterium]